MLDDDRWLASMWSREVRKAHTAQRVKLFRNLFQIIGLNIANVGHEIRRLDIPRIRPSYSAAACYRVTRSKTNLAFAVANLLVDVVVAQDCID